MWVLDLVKAWVAAYNTIDKKISDTTWWKKNIKSIATETVEKLKTPTKQTGVSTNNWSKYKTYDTSKIESTVKNPSQIFKGISKEDEDLILKIVNDRYAWASKIEKNNAIQWLYDTLLKQQKSKDIEAGREKIKLELTNQKNNAKTKKEKNTYNVQLKKADLADLIKEQLGKEWYDTSSMIWIVDDSIIDWFVEANPQYLPSFQKYFYNNSDVVDLGKELWWIEKSWWDKAKDKAKWFTSWMVWWMDKFWEWVDDVLWLSNKNESAWINYVQENYWTAPANLTNEDYNRAKAEFLMNDKKAYTPTLSSAVTKIMEWTADIAFTAAWLKWLGSVAKWTTTLWMWWLQTVKPSAWQVMKNVAKNQVWMKWMFAAASETPWLDAVPEFIGTTMWEVWWLINEIPVLKEIRDSLQTEQEKADWDAFIWGNFFWWWKKWGKAAWKLKYLDKPTLKQAYNDFRQNKDWKWTLESWIEENRKNKVGAEKLDKAQQISQWQIETREATSKWLDTLAERWKLDKIKNVDDLEKNTNETIDALKKEQDKLIQEKWYSKLSLDKTRLETPYEDFENWQKVTRYLTEQPFVELLDNIIEHYEDVDKAKANTYKSYKSALERWEMPTELLLELRREWNRLNQDVYNNKTNIAKDTKKAQKWESNISKVNKVIEWLNIWDDLRNMDSQLSALYTLQRGIKEIKKAEANYNKKAIKDGTMDSIAKSLWAFVSRVLGKLSFWWTNLVWKAAVSALQETLGWRWFTKETYNAAEIAKKIPEFVRDYKDLLKKLEWEHITHSTASKLLRAWMDKWESTMQYNKVDDED